MTHNPTQQHIKKFSDSPSGKRLCYIGTDNKKLALKLMEMGCLPGVYIEKLRTAVGAGPVLFKIYPGGQLLALRYEEAVQIQVREQ